MNIVTKEEIQKEADAIKEDWEKTLDELDQLDNEDKEEGY